jgi:hypothetical protein
MKKSLIIIALFVCSFTAQAQNFSSGSTGADGALDLSAMNCPNNVCEVQLPESGVLNYTTVSIPAGKMLKFKRNTRNTPVTLLAQGAIVINGAIDVSATGITAGGFCGVGYPTVRTPGPGGFYGGSPNQPGQGPGGGSNNGEPGKWVGPLSLVPIVGGSGGGGDAQNNFGGSGGGAIVIASSASINVAQGATINATGGADFSCFGFFSYLSNSGSGGAIRLVANSVNVSGGLSACNIFNTKCGVIRLEAPSGAVAFNGSANPPVGLFPVNPTVVPSAIPTLTLASIAGYPVPGYAGSRFDTYDMLLPMQLPDPINVVVRGNNIPLGTQVAVGFVNGSSQASSTPGTLSGTFESSTATATISGLNRTAVTYLVATAIFDPPLSAAKFNPTGPDQVAKIRVEAVMGAKPKVAFLRSNGTEVELAKVPQTFLKQFTP